MNTSLFISTLKTKGKTMFSYAFGSAFYVLLIMWIYPSFAKSNALDTVIKQMPQKYLSAFGFDGGMPKNLGGFLAGEFYGLLFLLILIIYSVILSTQLIVRLVDRGSMAYLLSTSVSRTKIAVSQAAVLILGLLLITLVTIATVLIGSNMIMDNNDLQVSNFIQMNVVGFLLFFVISGYSFFFSCVLNDEKRALSLSGGLTIVFFAINLVAKMSTDLEWLKYCTVFSTFNPSDIAKGTIDILPVSLGLGFAGLVLYALAILIFRKRDLPL
ncbi:ABC transporter permease subunit [Bacillus sp. FJAT-49736]|uniref:ABC transporter permease subunit n=1 Tax=Bacillus sp. FJAT-49736 TaxID=2833582 RepID=UPI001BC8DF59|nr:ABC transporter permease subunit [Bacillus sp. FJAT-49736]MBS4174612.1 ABC transporter permease subunit [Bacillus sp. FJAT-49736]